jgi:Zn-dependent peptidase ImmA (M78 family)/transcriptional regulator with XRE-family HTH domain
MDTGTLAANLIRLRTAGKLSQSELAEKAGLSRLAYRNIEAGGTAPRVDTLMGIAGALSVKLEDLLTPIRELKNVRFRAAKKMTSRTEVLAETSRWLDSYVELENILGMSRAESKLPKISKGESPQSAAALSRKAFGLGLGEPIRDIYGLLEERGVKVLAVPVASDAFFGLSIGPTDGGPAIVVNTWDRISVERWIFSAAHELGHLMLHLNENTFDVAKADEEPKQEKEADLFAACFLMPDDIFRKEWEEARGLSLLDRVFKLKKMFHVSYKSVLYRVSQDGDKKIWEKFQVAYKHRFGSTLAFKDEPEGLTKKEFKDPEPPSKGAEEPERVSHWYFRGDRRERLVREAVEKELITLGKAANILDISLREMREIANSWV